MWERLAGTDDRSSPTITLLRSQSTRLWWTAIVFYGLGDLVTTQLGVGFDVIVEAGPIAHPVIGRYGFLGMVGLKTAVFAASAGIYRGIPAPHDVGVPLGLAVFGVLVTCWNVVMIAIILA